MGIASVTAVVDFEVYVLLTMKLRLKMSQKLDQLEAKLVSHGLTHADGERIHARVGKTLGDETTFFDNLTKFLGAQHDGVSLEFNSVLWPGYAFNATVRDGGHIESALYRRIGEATPDVGSPTGQPAWSMDLADFTMLFGPLTRGSQWPLFDEFMPNYQECVFEWNGWSWGAGFSWGLFMFAAESWE